MDRMEAGAGHVQNAGGPPGHMVIEFGHTVLERASVLKFLESMPPDCDMLLQPEGCLDSGLNLETLKVTDLQTLTPRALAARGGRCLLSALSAAPSAPRGDASSTCRSKKGKLSMATCVCHFLCWSPATKQV